MLIIVNELKIVPFVVTDHRKAVFYEMESRTT